MLKNEPMIKAAKKALRARVAFPLNGKLLIVEDLPQEQVGNIVMAEMSQSEPHSGIVVAFDVETLGETGVVGDRVYYRPFAPTFFNLGPDSDGVEVGAIHYTDVILYEDQP